MKELVVISGKGGTGKTSIVGALSKLFDKKILADCDVDAADLHLLLNPEIQYKEEFYGGKIASIDSSKCVRCGICKNVCRFDSISDDFTIDPIDCEGCGVCFLSCPHDAINFTDHLNGEWYRSNTLNGKMIHASMTVGSENSGKLVTKLRTESTILARDNNIELIIIDGSPGLGCPVIASITSVHCCLIITEPTLSGLHDLKRVLDLTKKFRIKSFVCVNKYDINIDMTEQIKQYCSDNDIKVIGNIPYDLNVTKAQINGTNIIDYADSKAAKAILDMFNRLQELL